MTATKTEAARIAKTLVATALEHDRTGDVTLRNQCVRQIEDAPGLSRAQIAKYKKEVMGK